jgi:hypothetical protein
MEPVLISEAASAGPAYARVLSDPNSRLGAYGKFSHCLLPCPPRQPRDDAFWPSSRSPGKIGRTSRVTALIARAGHLT